MLVIINSSLCMTETLTSPPFIGECAPLHALLKITGRLKLKRKERILKSQR
jgi:hypothetical protein